MELTDPALADLERRSQGPVAIPLIQMRIQSASKKKLYCAIIKAMIKSIRMPIPWSSSWPNFFLRVPFAAYLIRWDSISA